MSKNKSFKEQYERLEQIVIDLSNEEQDIDKSIELFKEGIKLYKDCEKKLNEAQNEITKLTKEGEEIPYE